jgi:hypothetical protein
MNCSDPTLTKTIAVQELYITSDLQDLILTATTCGEFTTLLVYLGDGYLINDFIDLSSLIPAGSSSLDLTINKHDLGISDNIDTFITVELRNNRTISVIDLNFNVVALDTTSVLADSSTPVIISTIVVTNDTGSTTYVEDTDYSITEHPNGDTLISFMSAGAINIGDIVLIDYDYRVIPTETYVTATVSYASTYPCLLYYVDQASANCSECQALNNALLIYLLMETINGFIIFGRITDAIKNYIRIKEVCLENELVYRDSVDHCELYDGVGCWIIGSTFVVGNVNSH